MTKNKESKVNELIEALTDARVVQAIVAAITPAIKLCMQEELGELRSVLKLLEGKHDKQNMVIKDLQNENSVLKRRVDSLDAEARNSTLVIRGIPENSYAERATGEGLHGLSSSGTLPNKVNLHASVTQDAVLNLCNNDLKLHLSSEHIVQAYRMRAKTPGLTRAVRVTFSTRKVRDAVFQERRRLKEKTEAKIYISEDLIKSASELYYEARKLVKEKRLNSCWTAGGVVFVKRLETDKPVPVRDIAALKAAC